MKNLNRLWNKLPMRIVGALALLSGMVFSLARAQAAEEIVNAAEKIAAPQAQKGQVLGLSECIRIAQEQQPALAAHRASLASVEANRQGLQRLRLAGILSREIPIRRQQAALGVSIASAGVETAEQETTYAVTRTYFTVIFAKEQRRVATQVVNELKDALANAELLLGKEGAPKDLTQNAVDRNKAYVQLAEMRLSEAEHGIQRALAALREAMGVASDYSIEQSVERLPESDRKISKEEVLNLALSRRGEITQAEGATEVACLEIRAQGTKRSPSMRTFASGSDIHARPIPQGTSNGEYRPEAVGIEMPPTLGGHKADRVERARDLYARTSAVVEKTRNLITLETENAWQKWDEAVQKIPKAKKAVELTDKVAADTLKDFKGGQNVPYKDVLETVVFAAQVRGQLNEARFNLLLALAALERVTAGGFSAGFDNK